ncbi:MAG: molecular chaperone DnaJ [Chloroflexi bacterium]|nr:MAG: molecular chaperone DnaJ [Chloroflexota bacterium]
MNYKDYYQILGVSKKATDKEIKKAYRRLAREYHPDTNQGDKQAEERFKEINEAYEVLGNPDNRTKYDQLGSNYHRYQQMGGNAADFDFSQWFAQGGTPGGQHINMDLGDLFGSGFGSTQSGSFSDFFNAIFGQQTATRQAPRQDYFGQQTASADMEQIVTISLEEAFHGTTRSFRQNGTSFTAKIPRGAKNGTKIRLKGKGNVTAYGQGDLFLVVQVTPHHLFKRVGNNLEVRVPVDVVTAVLGGKVVVPTLTGDVTLKIPAGTQSGQTFRLSKKGMPHLRQPNKTGDMMAKIGIRIPKALTPEELALYEKLAAIHPGEPDTA